MEKRVVLDSNSFFFNNVFLPVCKQVQHPVNDINVLVVNKERSEKLKKEIKDIYKFKFDYPENNNEILGVEVYRIGEQES